MTICLEALLELYSKNVQVEHLGQGDRESR